MNTTTEIIKRLRAVPMSQAEISRRTGIPQPRISRWESGDVPRGADDVLRLRALLDAPMETEQKQPPALDVQAVGATDGGVNREI